MHFFGWDLVAVDALVCTFLVGILVAVDALFWLGSSCC
jgi:hypothetical protein